LNTNLYSSCQAKNEIVKTIFALVNWSQMVSIQPKLSGFCDSAIVSSIGHEKRSFIAEIVCYVVR